MKRDIEESARSGRQQQRKDEKIRKIKAIVKIKIKIKMKIKMKINKKMHSHNHPKKKWDKMKE